MRGGAGTFVLGPSSDEEFLDRFGDAIDDRIAETVDELLEQRHAADRQRVARTLAILVPVLAATAASVLLHGSPAVWTIWPATAVICITGAWLAVSGKS